MGHEEGFLLDGLLLQSDKLVQREGFIRWEVYQKRARYMFQARLDAVVDEVVNLFDKLIKSNEACVDAVEVSVDIHALPSQDCHSGLKLGIKVLKMWTQDWAYDGDDASDDVLVQCKREAELVEVQLELLLLQHNHRRTLGHVDPHADEALGLANKLQYLRVEINKKSLFARMANDERCLKTRFGRFDGLGPCALPKGFKFDQRAGNAIVRFDDLFRFLSNVITIDVAFTLEFIIVLLFLK
jgi:hypothetical protein